jgi:sulfur-oxidizing protein SoxX
MRTASLAVGLAAALLGPLAIPSRAAPPPRIEGQALPGSPTGRPGDPARGRAIVVDRTRGLCLLCHSGPFPDQPFQGDLSPSLAGAGSRHSPGELRLRIVDGRVLNPDTIMPSYGRRNGLVRVGEAWRNRPILAPDEIEDVVAFLATLRD